MGHYKAKRRQKGQHYFYFNKDNEISITIETNGSKDKERYESGNYFKTRAKAEESKNNTKNK